MKRSRPSPLVESKRPKALRACTSCRRSKVRCQGEEWPSKTTCKRCASLDLSCSFTVTVSHSSSEPSNSNGAAQATNSSSGTAKSIHHVTMSVSDSIESVRNQDLPWGELKKGHFDYTTAPVIALETAVRRKHYSDMTSHGLGDGGHAIRLEDILDEGQRYNLLSLFATTYFPWLNLPDDEIVNDDPIWVLSQCAVAARHFDDTTHTGVERRLRKAAEDATFGQIFSPCPSITAIQALLVLSIWPPSRDVPSQEIKDHRMQLASAINMAKNRNLQAVEDPEGIEIRLWTSLANWDSLLCLGTDQKPTSERSRATYAILDPSNLATSNHIRDLRLVRLGDCLDIAQHGLNMRLDDAASFDSWYKEVVENLLQLDQVHRRIAPLRVVAKHESFHCEALDLLYYSSRVMVLHQSLSFARALAGGKYYSNERPWVHSAMHKDLKVPIIWGSDALFAAEAILTIFCSLSSRDCRNLSGAPDVLFTFTTLAAAFVFMAKFRTLQDFRHKLAGVSDELLWATINHMSEAALHSEHAPAKYAELITAWMRKWEDNVRTYEAGASTPGPPRSQSQPDNEVGDPLSNPDFLFDDSFWSSFMYTLVTPPGN